MLSEKSRIALSVLFGLSGIIFFILFFDANRTDFINTQLSHLSTKQRVGV